MKKLMIILGVLVLMAGYFSFGLFVIQPIGMVPEGTTILYFRLGMNIPFVASADGLLKDKEAGVSLMGRVVVLGAVASTLKDRKIIAMPYSKTLYLISTGGREYEN